MPVVLAILRVPVALGLLLALLLTVGCGSGTARQVAVDPVPVSAHQLPSDQRTVAKVEPSKPRPTVDASTPQSLLFADDYSEHEPYHPRGPPGLVVLPFFPAPLILPFDLKMPGEVGVVVERVVRGQHVVAWVAISPVGWRVGAVRTVGFRYYNPVTGRYISRDPIGYGDGPNVYLYVKNNPINRIDPLGLHGNYLTMGGKIEPKVMPAPVITLDGVQSTLDGIGMVPGLGEPADGVNGLISLARGNKTDAALSFGGMVPFAGWGATALKVVKKADDAAAAAIKKAEDGAPSTPISPEADGVDIHLNRPEGVTDAEWQGKIDAMNAQAAKGNAKVVHHPVRDGKAQREARKDGDIEPGHDADHALDLQFGGTDTRDNIRSTPARVNRSVGGQGGQRKQHPDGTPIREFVSDE